MQALWSVIYDPWTTQTNGSTVTRTPFPGNVIPASRIDPTAAKMLSYLWQPNNPGNGVTGANNSSNYLYDIYPYYNFMDRTDYNITDKLKFFARYSYLHTTETTSDYTGTGSVMRYFQGSTRNAVNASGDLVWTINPTTVFDVHTAYNGINDSFDSPSTIFGASGIAGLWPNNWYASYLPANPQVYFPNINITSNGGSLFSSSVTHLLGTDAADPVGGGQALQDHRPSLPEGRRGVPHGRWWTRSGPFSRNSPSTRA